MARKLLSLVVALAVVLSSMSFAFAADPKAVSADVKDAKVKAAVEKLVALNMVEGIDGKYVPDQKLKRSELTKLIVIALGLGPAADAAKGATQFSDVDANHWASGYISVAAGQGIVQGMGDGTFAPDSEVTFAQGITMLVRALGYKDEFLPGTWPGNYLAKASEKDVYAGLTIVPGAAVTRGNFAIMMSNTLDAKVIKIDQYDGTSIKYTESEKTLAKDKLKLDKAEVRLTGNARLTGLKSDEVSGMWTKSSTDTEIKGAGAANATFTSLTLAAGINSDLYMGSTCDIYVKDKDTVVFIAEKGISQVYWDGLDKFTGFDANATVLPDAKLRWSGKTLTVKGGELNVASGTASSDYATVYRTGAEDTIQWTSGYISAFLKGKDYGRFVVENGKVVFADIYRYDKLAYMVKSVDAEKGIVTYLDGTGNESTLNIANVYSGGAKFYKDGAEIAIKDIKAFDVLYISDSKVDSKNIGNVFVFAKTATGTLTGVKMEEGKAVAVELDSKGTTDLGDFVTYSKDNNETYKNDEDYNTLNDYYGLKVTLVIDNNKKIRHIYGEATTSGEMYGIVAKTANEAETVKIYTPNDESVTYSFEDTAAVYEDGTNFAALSAEFASTYNPAATGYTEDQYLAIKYKLNKDGKIAKKTVKTYKIQQDGGNSLAITGNFGDSTMNAAGVTYYATSDIKVVDVQTDAISTTGIDTDKLEVSKWDNFKGKEISSGTAYVYVIADTTNTKDVKAMFVVSGMNSITLDQKAAFLVSTIYTDGKTYGNFRVYGSTDTQKLEINGSIPSNITYGTKAAVMINMGASGKADVYASATAANTASSKTNFSTAAGYVYKIDGNKLTIGADDAAYKYEVASDAIIYEADGVQSFNNIDIGDMVVAVMKNGIVQSLELVNAKSEKTKVFSTDAVAMGYVSYDLEAVVSRVTGYYCNTANNKKDGSAIPASTSAGVQAFGNADGKIKAIVLDLWK